MILGIFVAAGLPLNLLLRPPTYGRFDARLLLAPTSGLAVTTIYAFFLVGLGQPIRNGTVAFWAFLGAAWLMVGVRYGKHATKWLSHRPKASMAAVASMVACGSLIIGVFFLLPFFRDSSLVFWHYSGSDGYFYMRVAERLENFSRWDLPPVGPYDGSAGFYTADFRLFNSPQGQGDKPGTFALLGELASLLGLLPHEVFSPLMAAAGLTLFLALTWSGGAFGMSWWLAPIFAAEGAVAMVVWYFGDNTFLGNMLTLPLVPAVLALMDCSLGLATGILGGILLGAMMVLFPTGPLAVVAVGSSTVVLAFVRTVIEKRTIRFIAGLLAWVLTTLLVMLPMLGYLLRSANILSFLNLLPIPGLYAQVPQPPSVHWGHVLEHTNWIWPALNLNVLPPYDLASDEKRFVALLVILYCLSLALVAWQRHGRVLLLGLGFATILLAGTLSGMVSDDYNLYRAAALFWFVPLALLFDALMIAGQRLWRIGLLWMLPLGLLFSGLSFTERRPVRAGVIVLVIAVLGWSIVRLVQGGPWATRTTLLRYGQTALLTAFIILLARFARDDYREFSLGWAMHPSDAQYTQADMDDRRAITALLGNRTIVLSSEIPTFTAFANVLMLFSSIHLGSPNYFYRFLFFPPDDPPKDVAYSSDLVLRTRKYHDVYKLPARQPRLYQSREYEVVKNDMVPFFDNETLPVDDGRRMFSTRTDINYLSQEERDVRWTLRFVADNHPGELSFAFDRRAQDPLTIQSDGTVTLPIVHLTPGLHELTLAAPDASAQLESMALTDLSRS